MRRWRTRRGRGGERGAVVLELAIIFPVLAVLAFGIINYSVGWRAGLVVNTATRDAARVAASDATAPNADYDALSTLNAGLSSDELANLTEVIVYKTTAADGAVPSACLAVTPRVNGSGVAGVCNVYAPAVVQDPNAYAGQFSTSGSCGALDGFWCPTSRNNTLTVTSTATPDSVGVYVKTSFHDITHTIFPSVTITRTAVMRLVPTIS